MVQPLEGFADTLFLADGLASATQSCLVPQVFARASLTWLVTLGEGYVAMLARLPLIVVTPRAGGGHSLGLAVAPRCLSLLGFAGPYLAQARGGRELRYPIIGGLLARAAGGHLALGIAREGQFARLWIEVQAFRPRLGLGPIYFLTQAQLHRLVTAAYLHQVVRPLLADEVVHSCRQTL